MKIAKIQETLSKPITKMIAGGFKPTGEKEESWLGDVFLFKENEKPPLDEYGNVMLPLAQLYLPSFPYIHPSVKNTQVLTVFISSEFPETFEDMGKNWVIREYENIDDLVINKEIIYSNSFLKPFPVKTEFIENDYPLWDGEEIPSKIADAVLKLEDDGKIESYYDIANNVYEHKMGGYPSYCQSGINFGEDFEFVFQISSDSKIQLNVVDNGSFMFAKNNKTSKWVIYYDFF